MIFDRRAKTIHEANIVFSNLCWNIWASSYKKITHFTENYSKWTIGPNVKHKAVKFLEYNIRENLDDLGFGHYFSVITPKE